MSTEREIVEAKLREAFPAEDYCAAYGVTADGYASCIYGWTEQIAAALRESRKADVETVRKGLDYYQTRSYAAPVHPLNLALAALSRLAGDEAAEHGRRSSPPPAEVKPSERIRELCRDRFLIGVPGSAADALGIVGAYLDEQHARGRK